MEFYQVVAKEGRGEEFTRVLHLHGTEGNGLTDLGPVPVILQKELSDS